MPNDIILPCNGTSPLMGSPKPLDTLIKQNYLGEFESEDDKAKARLNLGVQSEKEAQGRLGAIDKTLEDLLDKVTKHILDLEDPHKTLAKINSELEEFVRQDGTRPFTAPQAGKDPISNADLTTKKYVDNKVSAYFAEHNYTADEELLNRIKTLLNNYVLIEDIYTKEDTYSKEEVDKAFDKVATTDGAHPFLAPQKGTDPVSSSDLTTKRYVDKLIYDHLLKDDPHQVKQWVIDILRNYPTKADMAKVNEADIVKIATERATEILSSLREQENPLDILSKVKKMGVVLKDGTIPFEAPQSGKPAVKDDQLVTLKQLKDLQAEQKEDIADVNKEIEDFIERIGLWYTAGPVETTVGYVEDGTELPEELTLQEIMDLIFYGKGVDIIAPEYAEPGTIVKVCLKVKGSPTRVKEVILYQDDLEIWRGTGADFEMSADGTVCVDSKPLTKDPTHWHAEIQYLKGVADSDAYTKLVGATFIGILDEFRMATSLSYEDYLKLLELDPVNNFKVLSTDPGVITHEFDFSPSTYSKQIFVATPKDNPDLEMLVTRAQAFEVNKESFNIVTDIPLVVNGVTEMYKVFVYREPIISLSHEEITFKFAKPAEDNN